MKKLLLIISLTLPLACFAQKIYVWCPDNNQITQREGLKFSDTVKVTFFDGRSIPTNNKIECSFEQLSASVFSQLKYAYPHAIVILAPETDYYKKTVSEHNILIKIGVASYQAGFGTDISGGIGMIGGSISTMIIPKGQWNALTAFHVQVIANSNVIVKDFANVASKSNLLGYKSAKKALNECYNKSVGELLFFIDEQLPN